MDSRSSDSIQVCVRVRPPNTYHNNAGLVTEATANNNHYCLDVVTPTSLMLHSKPEPKTFTFDHVAKPSVTQEDIFLAVGRPIIDSCMDGYNGTIFAYGQTGSGKTFTMIGPGGEDNSEGLTHELRGVIPRSFEYLFSLINREKLRFGETVQFLCKCSFIEIYNEHVYDLLDSASPSLHLRENIKRGVYVDGLVEQVVSSAVEAYEVLNCGWMNRRVASTAMNRESSRSHAVFMLCVESKKKDSVNAVCKIRSSTLNLVDLAGSERQRDANTAGARLKEAGSINKSLSALGNVIMALVEIAGGRSRHVHYRDSKLTFLLRDSLGGNSKTNLIANVHPLSRCFGETLSTLQFAKRAKLIKNKAVINEDTTGNVAQLQLEIKKLKEIIDKTRSGPAMEPELCRLKEEGSNETMLSTLMDLRGRAESDNKGLRDRIDKLHELCRRKDKSLQATKMILKLRNSRIASLEKNDCETTTNTQAVELLQEEIKNLKQLIDHHPDVTKYAVENIALKADIEKLKEASRCHGNGNLEEEVTSLRQYTLQLEGRLRDVGGAVTEGNAPAVKQLAELNLRLTKLQERHQKTQNELDMANKLLLVEREDSKTKISSLEIQLCASEKAMKELEVNMEAVKLRHQLEHDSLNDTHIRSLKALATPSSLRRVKSTTSTPLHPLKVSKLRQELFFHPLSEDSAHNNEKQEVSDEDNGYGIIEEEEVGGSSGDDVMESCEVGVVPEALWAELQTLKDTNNDIWKQLESKEHELVKMRTSEASLTSQVQGLSQQLEEMRTSLSLKSRELATCVETNDQITAELKQGEEVLREEVRDLRLCLQSADKELAEVKGDLKKKEKQVTDTFLQIGSLEEEITNKTTSHERAIEDLRNVEDELATLRAEHEFKSHYLEEKDKEIASLTQTITTIQTENESLRDTLLSEEERVRTLVLQLGDAPDSAQLASSLEENKVLVQEKKELQEKLLSEERDLAAAQISIDSLTNQLSYTQTTLNDLRRNLNRSSVKEAELRAELESTKTCGHDQETRLTECIKNNDSLKVEIANLREAITKQQYCHLKELKAWELQQEINEAQIEELQDNGRQLVEMNETCEKLRCKLDSKDTNRVELERKLSTKETEIQQLRETLKEVTMVSSDNGDSQSDVLYRLEEEKTNYANIIMELQDQLEEKSLQLRDYNVKLRSYETLQSEYDLLKTQSLSQQYQIEADKEENLRRHFETEKELNTLRHDLNTSLKLLATIEQQRNHEKELAAETEEKYNALKGNVSLMEDQLTRIRTQEEMLFREKEELRSQLETTLELKAKLIKENQDIIKENAQLSGHRNTKQRIQFHAKLKMDYHKLIEAYGELTEVCQQQATYIAELGGDGTLVKGVGVATGLKSGKENVKPQ